MGRRSRRKNERSGRRALIWVNLRPRRAQSTSRLLRVVPRAEHLSPPTPPRALAAPRAAVERGCWGSNRLSLLAPCVAATQARIRQP